MKKKKINEQVIVITGASSGIGLATAKLAARQGAKLVLSSRNEEDLRRIREEIRGQGGEAEYVAADVARTEEVQTIADFAIARFGGFDTWINNAGVSIYGKLTETPMDEKRRVFDVNFWGVVNGCRAAVPVLRKTGGTIINLGSIASDRSIPMQGIYSATKHAIKAYTDALRMELEAEGAPVQISLIKPAAIDTPYVEHARNRMDEGNPNLPPPIYAPEVVAKAILECAVSPHRDVYVGGAGKVFSWMEKFFPRLSDLYMERTMIGQQRTQEARPRNDVLESPAEREGRISGGYSGHVMRSSLFTTASLHPVRSAVIFAGFGAAAYSLFAVFREQSDRRVIGSRVSRHDYWVEDGDLDDVPRNLGELSRSTQADRGAA